MRREEHLTQIIAQFDRSSKLFCERTNGGFCEITDEYKGEKKPQNLRYRFAKIYYNAFAVEFKYTAHGPLSTVNSIVECLVYLDKTQSGLPIPLPLLVDYCDIDIATPLCIPLISNTAGMCQAFDCIESVLHTMLDRITSISLDPDQRAAVLRSFKEELRTLFDLTTPDAPDGELMGNPDLFAHNGFFYRYLTLRFTSIGFINLIKGDRTSAIKEFGKIKNLTGYETRILNILRSDAPIDLPDLSITRKNANIYNKSGGERANLKEFGAIFLSWIPLTVGMSLIYCAFYFSLMWIEGRASFYLMGPIYNFPFCIVFGFITAIAVSYFTRFHFYRWLHKKDYERYCEIDYIQNGGGADKPMKVFLYVLLAIGLSGCILLSRWNINFRQDGFIDNTAFFSLRGEYHDYSEIDRVYYQPDRVNSLGETLNFPSYVLVLKDGKEIDFYEYDDIEKYEDTLLSFLKKQGVTVKLTE